MNYEERRKIAALIEKEIELNKKLNESSGEYLNLIKQIKSLHNEISNVRSLYLKQQEKVRKAEAGIISMTAEELEIEKEKEKVLAKNLKYLEQTTEEYTKMAKEVSKTKKAMAFLGETKKDVVAIGSAVKNTYNRFKSWSGLFDIDKSIRTASLSMGLLGKRSEMFRSNLKAASTQTIDFGVGMKELAELQSNFSQELGRTVLLNKENLIAMGEMAAATGLGAEGTAKMAADMELQGYSAERTRDFIEQTMNDSSKMGLNASKVVKNMQQGMKLLNRYNFKGGVKGLKQMSETVTRLGIDMGSVSGMADKLFDIDGAVEMSAQLQVLGGSWANLGDPFKLMYMARNDMAGLTEEIAKAAAGSATFNKENGEFEISAMELHRLRKIAEQTGMEYETLATAAKNAAKFSRIKSQLRVSYGDKDMQKFIEDTATINERGEAVLELASGPKLVKDLRKMDANAVKAMMAEQQSLKERADASQTFDDKLTNLVNQFKQTLFPFIEALSKGLEGPLGKLSDALKDPKTIQMITDTATKIGEVIGKIGTWIVENPFKSLLSLGLFEAGKWFLNGIALGKGFNTVANAGGGGSILDSLTGGKSTKGRRRLLGRGVGKGIQGLGRAGGKIGGGIGKIGGKIAGGVGKTLGKSLLKKIPIVGLLAGLGFGVSRLMDGDWAGALGEVASGAASIIPGVGTAASVAIDAGLAARDYSNEEPDMNDGVIKFNKKDKFMKVNDSTMIAGTNENGNKDLAKALMFAAPGIGASMFLKDYMTNKMSQTTSSNPSPVKIEFGEIKFRGEINLTSPGGPGTALDITKDPILVKKLTELIHIETEKAIQGGKVKG
jgi:hypothetical protein